MSIEDYFQKKFAPEYENFYVKYFSSCKSWDCKIDEQKYREAVEIINSFDLIVPEMWHKDPRIWTIVETVLKDPTAQFTSDSASNYQHHVSKKYPEGTPSEKGWKYGSMLSIHPTIEKWLELHSWWDLQLYKYIQKLVYTRISPTVSKRGVKITGTYEDYLTRPEWNFHCERILPNGVKEGIYLNGEPPDYSKNVAFPKKYDTNSIPFGNTVRNISTKLEAVEILKNGTGGVWMLHFHKGGGTSLGNIAHKVRIHYNGSWEKPETNWGHFKHKTVWPIIQDSRSLWLSITSLRNPVMRLLSRYDFEERFGGQYGNPPNETMLWTNNAGSFEEVVFAYMDRRRYHNHATKVLGSRSWEDEIVDEDTYKRAISLLNTIDLVFVMEWYNDPRSAWMFRSVADYDD
eukprot:UN26238